MNHLKKKKKIRNVEIKRNYICGSIKNKLGKIHK